MLALLTGFALPRAADQAPRPRISARGPLLDAAEHPEWRQLLIHAAYKRAGELDRLRDLPDTPMIVAVPPVPVVPVKVEQLATLPAEPQNVEDVTGSIEETPGGTLPIEIGETSSAELPVHPPEVTPPVERPESLRRLKDGKLKAVRKKRSVRALPRTKEKPAPVETVTPVSSLDHAN